MEPVEPEPEETSVAEEWRRFALVVGYLSGGGFQVAIGAWVGHVAGRWIDGRLGITGQFGFGTWLALGGFAGGLYTMWRMVGLLQRRQEAEKAEKKKR